MQATNTRVSSSSVKKSKLHVVRNLMRKIIVLRKFWDSFDSPFRHITPPDFQSRKNSERHRPEPGDENQQNGFSCLDSTVNWGWDTFITVISDNSVGCCTSDSTDRAQNCINIAGCRSTHYSLEVWVVQQHWHFKHHAKVTKSEVENEEIWWRAKTFRAAKYSNL